MFSFRRLSLPLEKEKNRLICCLLTDKTERPGKRRNCEIKLEKILYLLQGQTEFHGKCAGSNQSDSKDDGGTFFFFPRQASPFAK